LESDVCATEAQDAVNLLDMSTRILCGHGCFSTRYTFAPPAAGVSLRRYVLRSGRTSVRSWTQDLGGGADTRCFERGAQKAFTAVRALSVSLDVDGGTFGNSPISVGPFDQTVFGEIANYQAGERIRMTNLYVRKDGQPAPTPTTVCFREGECPSFTLPRR